MVTNSSSFNLVGTFRTNRILIVEDHVLLRTALRMFLSQEADFQIVGEAGTMRDALRCIKTLSPQLVLTDITMPDAHGIQAVTEIKRRHPSMKIVVISNHPEIEYQQRCLMAGAAGYIVKDAICEELISGVRAVLTGRSYLSGNTSEPMARDYPPGSTAVRADRNYTVH